MKAVKLNHFFTNTFEAHINAAIAISVIAIFAILQVIIKPHNLYILSSILSVMLINVYMVKLFGSHIRIKLIYSVIVGFSFGFFGFLASFLYFYNIYAYTLVLVLLLIIVAYFKDEPPHVSVGILLSTNVYIIYAGLAGDIKVAAITGGMTFVAALIFTLLLWIQVTIFPPSRYRKMPEQKVFLMPKVIFTRGHLRYAMQLVVSVVIANSISYYYHLPFGYWLPMTVYLMYKNSHLMTMQTVKHRFMGTIFGCIIAFSAIHFIDSLWLLTVLLLLCCYIYVISLGQHYGSYTFFFTFAVILVLALGNHAWLNTSVLSRLGLTVLGLVIVLATVAVSYFLDKRYPEH
ncbi:FUSC family protein [Cysteiniphilum sp. JM-1]|uniref:FUSC family protein n=1 Tax=Cysteiniphilum sp. JM-1 TaxID=2610891 RepID=UPI00124852E5|nr:FUSC family protein [Cysteiniphilum sp. JM-1]